MSGYSDKEYLKGAIQLEAVSYVEKPISIEEVEEALLRAVEKQRKIKQKNEKIRRLVTENHSMTARHLIEKMSIPHLKRELLEQDFAKLRLDWGEMQLYFLSFVREKIQRRGLYSGRLGRSFVESVIFTV